MSDMNCECTEGNIQKVMETSTNKFLTKMYSKDKNDAIRKIVDHEHELYILRHKNNRSSLIDGGYNQQFSCLMLSCISRYCLTNSPCPVKVMNNMDLHEKMNEPKATISRRGASVVVTDELEPFEICCSVDYLPEAFEGLKEGQKAIKGIRTTTYLSKQDYVEQIVLCLITKVIGVELCNNIVNFCENDVVNEKKAKCEINCPQVFVDIESKRLRFGLVAGINVRLFSDVNETPNR